MGKKAKEHRKKVKARNEKIKGDNRRRQKILEDIYLKRLEAAKQAENDLSSQSIKLNTDGFIQSAEIL